MKKLPRVISIAAQVLCVLGLLAMAYGVFRFFVGPPEDYEGDPAPWDRAKHALLVFAAGGVLLLVACVCVYVERFKDESPDKDA